MTEWTNIDGNAYQMNMMSTVEEIVVLPRDYDQDWSMVVTVNTFYNPEYSIAPLDIFFMAIVSFLDIPFDLKPYLQYLPGGTKQEELSYENIDYENPFPGTGRPPMLRMRPDLDQPALGVDSTQPELDTAETEDYVFGTIFKLAMIFTWLICLMFIGYFIYLKYSKREQDRSQLRHIPVQQMEPVSNFEPAHEPSEDSETYPPKSYDTKHSMKKSSNKYSS